MSRRTSQAVVYLTVFVFLTSCWMLYCENRKTNDNLPSLQNLMAMDVKAADDRVQGYMEHQLLEVWGRPSYSDEDTLAWKTSDGSVTAHADPQGEITNCRIHKIIDLPVLYDLAFLSDQEVSSCLMGRFTDQITSVWDSPELVGAGKFRWNFPPHSPHQGITVDVDRWGRICHTKFKD